jgi:(2Fe-2S) ferredoxin
MKSLAELSELRNSLHTEVAIRAGEVAGSGKYEVLVCGVAGCLSSDSVKIQERIAEKAKEMGIADKVKVVPTGCFGLCAEGPILAVFPGGNIYTKVKVEDVDEIVEEDIINGKAVERLLLVNETGGLDTEGNLLKNVDFFGKQKKSYYRT